MSEQRIFTHDGETFAANLDDIMAVQTPEMPITMPHGGIPDFRYTPPSGREHRRNRRAAARRIMKKKKRNK